MMILFRGLGADTEDEPRLLSPSSGYGFTIPQIYRRS
jgi:hypothetical protein